MNGYYNQVIEKLKANGYTYLRAGKGAHEIWTNGKRNQTLSKNMPSRNMANAIMKQCGIEKSF
jgi:predicted RNA binding protein YcfA (HicA-like mRNA interferase family)